MAAGMALSRGRPPLNPALISVSQCPGVCRFALREAKDLHCVRRFDLLRA